ncbi:MAG: hypothetical protein U0M06_08470 [Clostridia bacterium]|nr:hypothetical protein [Clostridia bacterium]
MEEKNKETEKKFLIKYPCKELLCKIGAENRSHIVQTYLISEENISSRVRMRIYENVTKYFKTEKKQISDMTCFEDERELTEEEYISELKNADPDLNPVEKERLLIISGKHTFEIDIYPFWQDRAIMEVELTSEDEEFSVPKGIDIIKDVTGDARYKNISLAREIPM